jgi:hypothetical protein
MNLLILDELIKSGCPASEIGAAGLTGLGFNRLHGIAMKGAYI